MTDQIAEMAQRCYDKARDSNLPTRDVARDMVAAAPRALVAAMAVEYLVGIVADAQRATALEVERAATVSRKQQSHEGLGFVGVPRKGTKARDEWERTTPEGQAWAAQEEASEYRKIQMLSGVIKSGLERYAEDLRVQWTAELMDSTFALRDGTIITWGDATIDQHLDRQEIFLKNAHANMEGAARHEVAIRELRAAGKNTLREMVGVSA